MKNLAEFFKWMDDVSFEYVVMRNWEEFLGDTPVAHPDIDLLVYDLGHWIELFPDAKRVYEHPRVMFTLEIGDMVVQFDVRYIGDRYYPEFFEKEMIKYKCRHPAGFWIPSKTHHMQGLAYHVAHHKNANMYPKWLGDIPVPEILASLKQSAMGWVEPEDPSVGRYNGYMSCATSIVEKTETGVVKKQRAYMNYNLTDNEARMLEVCGSRHFPNVLRSTGTEIELEDCGEQLCEKNLPSDWKVQLKEILGDLKAANIQHRDIQPNNLMVKDGVIKLIDFGWARFYDDPPDNPPSCLGNPFKPSHGFDDAFSMRKTMKVLEFEAEGCGWSEIEKLTLEQKEKILT